MPHRVKVSYVGADLEHYWVDERRLCIPSSAKFSVGERVGVKHKGTTYEATILHIVELITEETAQAVQKDPELRTWIGIRKLTEESRGKQKRLLCSLLAITRSAAKSQLRISSRAEVIVLYGYLWGREHVRQSVTSG